MMAGKTKADKGPTIRVTSGGRVYVNVKEQLKTDNAKKAIEDMNRLFKTMDAAKSAKR